EPVELSADEVLIQNQPREGLAVAVEHGVTVAVDTQLTRELITEGLARDVIRRVQNLRKELGLNLDDRIVTVYQADDELAAAIEEWRELIMAETLSVQLSAGEVESAAAAQEQIAGHALRVEVQRAH
ncbi:MAG: isoleucine--tRNA ligase, partial [Anaerolineales bacterium]|nr:isoleucine--tRNA ligase [Anaerolineales bacterium]